jgi:hypothetical protein
MKTGSLSLSTYLPISKYVPVSTRRQNVRKALLLHKNLTLNRPCSSVAGKLVSIQPDPMTVAGKFVFVSPTDLDPSMREMEGRKEVRKKIGKEGKKFLFAERWLAEQEIGARASPSGEVEQPGAFGFEQEGDFGPAKLIAALAGFGVGRGAGVLAPGEAGGVEGEGVAGAALELGQPLGPHVIQGAPGREVHVAVLQRVLGSLRHEPQQLLQLRRRADEHRRQALQRRGVLRRRARDLELRLEIDIHNQPLRR